VDLELEPNKTFRIGNEKCVEIILMFFFFISSDSFLGIDAHAQFFCDQGAISLSVQNWRFSAFYFLNAILY
jgi:hypothetical protein